MTERRIYNNDPIQEAVCEFRFRAPAEGWPLLPGQLFDRLGEDYPAEPSQDGLMPPMAMPPQAGAIGLPGLGFQIAIGSAMPGRIRLRTEDNSRSILIGPGAFSIHAGRPYPLWETFSERIRTALVAFSQIHQTFDIERIGLRYINRIEAAGTASDLQGYFEVQALQFPGISLTLTNFIGRSEQYLNGDKNRVVIATFASAPAEEGTCAFILDLDIAAQQLEGITSTDPALAIVEDLRSVEKSVFEASLTEKARQELFGGYEVKGSE